LSVTRLIAEFQRWNSCRRFRFQKINNDDVLKEKEEEAVQEEILKVL